MFTSIWRFLVYRVVGGRFLLALTVLTWLWRKVKGRQAPPPPPPAPGSASAEYRAPR